MLKLVDAGFFGEEWKQLHQQYPEGSVDFKFNIYLCECGYWSNDEVVDFYLELIFPLAWVTALLRA